MSRALFELYKEALRRGHVAVVQGRLDAAVTAYEAACTIAPDRALPHASLGDVLRRLGRPEAAEHAYDAALQRAPMDEAGLRGRAAARLALDRPVDAARDLEALADVLERANRIPEACEVACSALELGGSRNRQQAVERLAAALTGLAGEIGVVAALARAEPFLDPSRRRAPAMAADAQGHAGPVGEPVGPEPTAHEQALDSAEPAPAEPEPAAAPEPEPAAAPEPEPAPAEPEPAAAPEPESAPAEPEPAAAPDPESAEPEPEPVAAVEPAETGEAGIAQRETRAAAESDPGDPEPAAPPVPIDVVAARLEAESLLAVGESAQARGLLLEIAASERAAGHLDSALDACLILVAIDPADVAVQVELAEIQVARGWTNVARDKLALLTRLADLDADAAALAIIEGSAVAQQLASSRGKSSHHVAHP